ncbi:MAG: hypothetical protein LAO31_06670 [Acidobacteriia bacterium]|nr:hypothetical protein [Terriglobia bacterium]
MNLRRKWIVFVFFVFFLWAPVSMVAQLTLTIRGSGAATETSLGQGPLVTAHGRITTDTLKPLGASAIFGFTQSGILTSEASISASSPMTAARLVVDFSLADGRYSGVAVSNPSDGSLTLSVQLNDAEGSETACPEQSLPGKGHFAMFASQLCPDISDPFLGTLTLTSSTPFVATTLLWGTNSHGEPLFNSLPVADPTLPPQGNVLFFPHFADGGGFTSELLLMNLTPSAIAGTVSFFSDNGQPAALTFGAGLGVSSLLSYRIPGNGVQKFSTAGWFPGAPLKAGYIVLTSTGGSLPSGAVVFSEYSPAGGLESQAGVLNSPVTYRALVYAERTAAPLSRDTGVAVVNPNGFPISVQLRLESLKTSFMLVHNGLRLPANNHFAGFIDQDTLMGSLVDFLPPDFQGLLTLSSSDPFTAVALRLTTNQRGENLYSTLPVVDVANPPTAPLDLPQIVNGGGYTTQIVLINPGSDAGTATVNFFKDNGEAVAVEFPSTPIPMAVSAVAGGVASSYALRIDHSAWSWGANGYGQLGNGSNFASLTPGLVSGLTNVSAIAGGYSFSAALKEDGTVWTWGENDSGQLGDGTTVNAAFPVQVQSLTSAIAVSLGQRHSLALKNDGTVCAWGSGGWSYLLGNGSTATSTVPVEVQGASHIIAISAGTSHSLALATDGTVWAWGGNSAGELGIGSFTQPIFPVKVPGLSAVVGIAAGAYHSLALRSNGTVWAWGDNSTGEIGDGTIRSSTIPQQVSGMTGVIAIAAGSQHSLALKSDGTVWTWGFNRYGQLGNGATIDSSTPVRVEGLPDVVAIAGGGYHGLALKKDGTVWAWGANSAGQLGDGTTNSSATPVQVELFR